jgi:hypothetical protein
VAQNGSEGFGFSSSSAQHPMTIAAGGQLLILHQARTGSRWSTGARVWAGGGRSAGGAGRSSVHGLSTRPEGLARVVHGLSGHRPETPITATTELPRAGTGLKTKVLVGIRLDPV